MARKAFWKNNKVTACISFLANPYVRIVTCILFLLAVYAVLYKIYIPKVNAFGCFDDCANFVEGYFVGRGKQLYTQVYDNHMPLMAYLSTLIQYVGKPINIYALVLQHRQVLLAFSFLFNLLIILRFGLVGAAFSLVYEFSKFYVFGDRFLAESFVVYPLIYLVGLGLRTLQKKYISNIEILCSSGMAWFVVFMREPYIPAALVSLAIILFPLKSKKIRLSAIGIFALLTALLFLLFPARDFFFNVITINFHRGLPSEIQAGNFFGMGVVKSFFYPIYVLFQGSWTQLRIELIALTLIMGISCYLWIQRKKSVVPLLYIFVLLGLTNLRPTFPGQQYFEAFHMINWYGLYIFTTLYLLHEVVETLQREYVFIAVAGVLIFYTIFNPKSFIYQRVNEQTEFITNYGKYLQIGEIIRAISKPGETLFTDGADEFLYWSAHMDSSYRYSFYYPAQAGDRYYLARIDMFTQTPPDIYYDLCTPQAPTHPSLPPQIRPLYAQWYSEGKPTCLYIKQSLASRLTDTQKAKAMEFLYYLPEK